MTKTEIDVMWNRALREAIEGGEEFTRYRFAAMVASQRDKFWTDKVEAQIEVEVEAEREACAQVCDEASIPHPDETHSDAQWALLKIAVAIRARGRQ
jgi:hypothetical protein